VYTGKEFDFNSHCPKMAMKTLGQTQNIWVDRVRGNRFFFGLSWNNGSENCRCEFYAKL